MKSLYTIAVIGAVVLSSCSVYRQGQTPDDVYFSPAREEQSVAAAGYVPANSGRNDGRRYNDSRSSYDGYDDYATMDDRWLMMRVRNPYRWSLFDDYSFYSPYSSFYSPYGFGAFSPYNSLGWGYSPGWSFGLGFGAYNPYGFGFGNYYNNYWNWNSYFNPYYPHVVVVNPKTNPAGYTRARTFNLNRYDNNTLNRSSIAPRYNNFNNNNNSGRVRYNNSNNSRVGGSDRYYNTNRERPSYNAPSQDRPVRSYTPSNSPSYSPSSSGSSGGGGGSSPAGSRPSRR